MNFHNKKTQKLISTIIIIILVLAMVVPSVLSFLSY
jgi:flagellar basal body-associated protein FliL